MQQPVPRNGDDTLPNGRTNFYQIPPPKVRQDVFFKRTSTSLRANTQKPTRTRNNSRWSESDSKLAQRSVNYMSWVHVLVWAMSWYFSKAQGDLSHAAPSAEAPIDSKRSSSYALSMTCPKSNASLHWSIMTAWYMRFCAMSTGLVNDMTAQYARFLCECFLVWRVKEGNAARERTNAPINRARRIKACSSRMQNTEPLDPWYHCHSSNWSWFCVSVKFVIGIDMKSSIVKYRFDALTWVLHARPALSHLRLTSVNRENFDKSMKEYFATVLQSFMMQKTPRCYSHSNFEGRWSYRPESLNSHPILAIKVVFFVWVMIHHSTCYQNAVLAIRGPSDTVLSTRGPFAVVIHDTSRRGHAITQTQYLFGALPSRGS
ncbi:hypothetical protein EDD22DRAFT_1050134 [Suillus occidentalis]|nr:hypothetical protein EDD22DRAFT_1050134 [Suillus occidentalis]